MSKFNKKHSLMYEARREGRHCWRTYQCSLPKKMIEDNKAKNFSVEGAMIRACKKVRKGNVTTIGNRRIR